MAASPLVATGRWGISSCKAKVRGGLKGVLQTSKGIQEIFIQVGEGAEEVARAIRDKF